MKENRSTNIQSNPNDDKISILPDPILIRILSFLPTKQFIETATVSKRWRYLWLSATSLIFHFDVNDDGACCYFIDFVATTLMFNNAPKLDKFLIALNSKWHCRTNGDTTVTTWIRYATTKNAEEIHVHLSGPKYRLPEQVYKNDRVRVMSFKGCEFVLPTESSVSWPSLELLTITDCGSITKQMINKILDGCPRIICLDIIDSFDANRGSLVDIHYHFIRVKSN